MLTVRKYEITITMCDGSQGHHTGIYEDGFDAVVAAMELFPDAFRIAARRLS